MLSLDYDQFMERAGAYLELKLEISDLVEVRELGDMLGSLADQYDDHVKEHYGDQAHEGRFYVQEIKRGSIIMQFIANTIGFMDQTLILKQFFDLTKDRFGLYLNGVGEPKAAPEKRKQIADMVRAVAEAEEGKLSLAYKEKDADGSEAVLVIEKGEAREVLSTALQNKLSMIENDKAAKFDTRRRVLMVFFQTNKKTQTSGKNSGERVIIEEIDKKPKALIYESVSAENQVKHEMLREPDNIYLKGFIVDVSVEMSKDRIVAYRLLEVHQIIDIEPDEEPQLLLQ